MATVGIAPSAEKAADLLQNLSLDVQKTTLEVSEPAKKIQSFDRSATPFLPNSMDPTMCYLPNGYPSPAYFYGSFNVTGNGYDDFSRYFTADGVEMTSGIYGDNGSVIFPNGYGYASYGPYSPATSPVPTLGNDGQLYGPQHYQYPTYFQVPSPTSAPFTPIQVTSSQRELSTATATDQKPLPVETAKVNCTATVNSEAVKGKNGSTPYRPSYQNSPINANNIYEKDFVPVGTAVSGYQDARFGFDGPYRSSGITSSFSKANNVPLSRNRNFHQNSNPMRLHHLGPRVGSTNGHGHRMYPNQFYGQYDDAFRSAMGFGSGGYDSRTTKGRGNGFYGYCNENVDSLNELNRGPRAKGFVPVTFAVKEQNVQPSETIVEEKAGLPVVPEREHYNKPDFPADYTDAKFFVIKSYSEDDIHKSIKYNVWASTPNGNKKLNAAYQKAQQKSGGCPVFLFFSVNTSGQFVGLAEMVGPVDFHKNMEYWQQDKWTGCFSVNWRIVKDIPNSLLKHITLENNENKPVTNSRDTQEIMLEQGLKMIKIFKDHASKVCILDDFEFYEKRQTIIQEKKAKQLRFKKQATEEKHGNEKKEVENGSCNVLEIVTEVVKLPSSNPQSNVGNLNHARDVSMDTLKLGKPVP